MPDVYVYDPIPPQLKVQIVHIIDDTFGVSGYPDSATDLYQTVVGILCREYGVFQLVPNSRKPRDILFEFITKESVSRVNQDENSASIRMRTGLAAAVEGVARNRCRQAAPNSPPVIGEPCRWSRWIGYEGSFHFTGGNGARASRQRPPDEAIHEVQKQGTTDQGRRTRRV